MTDCKDQARWGKRLTRSIGEIVDTDHLFNVSIREFRASVQNTSGRYQDPTRPKLESSLISRALIPARYRKPETLFAVEADTDYAVQTRAHQECRARYTKWLADS